MDGSGAASKAFKKFPIHSNSESYERRGSSTVDPLSKSQQQPTQPKKPCRSCTDFRTWMVSQKNASGSPVAHKSAASTLEDLPTNHTCPLDINELGKNTWGLLHTVAANYPDRPTLGEQHTVKLFFESFSKTYPCEMCAHDFQKRLKNKPVRVENQQELSLWLCQMHNGINKMLRKPIFDCSKVNERWRDGWTDGSCG